MPAAVVIPLRFFRFGDADPITIVFLGPALEEGVKLAALFLALMGMALALPRGNDPDNALRYWLFLTPWLVGGVYGLLEGLVVYPGESHLNFTLRELAHAAFSGLALAAALWAWREIERPYVGVLLGFAVAWAAHILFNSLAFLGRYIDVSFAEQAAYALAILALAAIALARGAGRGLASREARSFLAIRGRRVRT